MVILMVFLLILCVFCFVLEKNGEGEKKNTGEIVQKKDPVGGNKKDGNLTADVFVTKGVKAIRRVGDCVEEYSENLTVEGKFGSATLREIVEQKTHIRVEFIPPVPKIDGKGKGDAGAGEGKKNQISPVPKEDGKGKGDSDAREEKKKQNKEKDSKQNKEDKKTKEKEPPITTAVLKVHLPCQECIQDFLKIVTKFNGYNKMKIDKEKDLATVTGSMNNMEDLASKLKHLKKKVEIVSLEKEGGDKKEKAKAKGGEGNGEGKGKVKA